MYTLIADSGSTKCEWCLLQKGKKKIVYTQGISPYFLNGPQITAILLKELFPKIKDATVSEVFYYGTGCNSPENKLMVKKAIAAVFISAKVYVDHDLMGASRALCGDDKGIACILGTGSNSGYFDGRKIKKNSPGLGYVLGDEGSGAYLGKKLLQYYLYNTLDEALHYKFNEEYHTNRIEILDQVYKKPLPNRYLASFALFLSNNRGHYTIENILEDGLNDFFFTHLCKYSESWKYPIHFTGAVAFGFRDVIIELAQSYEFELGQILKKPMDGLVSYHS